MAWYSMRNGLLKPFSFGTRCLIGIWPPSKPRATVLRAFWPLVPRPAVLPPLPPMPRPTRLGRRFEPGAGCRSWIFTSDLFAARGLVGDRLDNHEVRDPGEHATDLGTVGQGVRMADTPQAE